MEKRVNTKTIEVSKKFRWVCFSDDTAFVDESVEIFDSETDCYNHMRDAVLSKMKWNTEHDDDFAECSDDFFDGISYKVHFAKRMIIHYSFSGCYVYKIVRADENPLYDDVFTKDVVDYITDKNDRYSDFPKSYFNCYKNKN